MANVSSVGLPRVPSPAPPVSASARLSVKCSQTDTRTVELYVSTGIGGVEARLMEKLGIGVRLAGSMVLTGICLPWEMEGSLGALNRGCARKRGDTAIRRALVGVKKLARSPSSCR